MTLRKGMMDRSSMANQFVSDNKHWKTYVLEAHPVESAEALLRDAFGHHSVGPTDDDHLFTLSIREASYYVDTLDGRFWSFHTSDSVGVAERPLTAATSRRHDLDRVWLPSAHLRAIERHGRTKWVNSDFKAQKFRPAELVHDLTFHASGGTSQNLLDAIAELPEYTYALSLDRVGLVAFDELLGTVDEAVTRKASFLASGESFALHQLVVAGTIERYRDLVEAAEALAIGFESSALHRAGEGSDDSSGGQMSGTPIELRFSRPLADFDGFLSQIFSSRAPFRLWGNIHDYSDAYAEVEAVDLHVGGRIRLEISPTMIRIHLRRNGCGNSVARLISNLQHHVDGNISAVEQSIQSRLVLNAA